MAAPPASVRIGTLNMCDGRNGRMNHGVNCLQNHRIDIGVFTETKYQRTFSQVIDNYQLYHCVSHAPNSGGVTLAYRTNDTRYSVESVHCDTNMVYFQLLIGAQRFIVVGTYTPPLNVLHGEQLGDRVQRVFQKYPNYPRILLGDLNANPHRTPLRAQDAIMAANWAEWGLDDLGSHFRSRHGNRFATWHQMVDGQMRTSICDFILTDKRAVFTKLKAAVPRYCNTDHRVLWADIRVTPAPRFVRDLKGRRRPPPLNIPNPDPTLDPLLDACFASKTELPADQQVIDKSTWVSATLLRLYDERSNIRRRPHTRGRRRALRQNKKRIKRQRRLDRLRHAENACTRIEDSLREKDLDSAWGWCKAWYKEATLRPSRPSPLDLQEIADSFGELYTEDGVVREAMPTHVQPAAIDDTPPTDEEIATAVRRLRNRRVPGHYGLKAENLKSWLADFAQLTEENIQPPENHPWLRLTALVREVFIMGKTPSKLGVGELVILPKPSGGVRGIGLLDPIWKVISSIIDFRVKTSVQWDKSLHGFLPNRSTGTAILNTRLRSDLATARLRPYHRVYIDLEKAYDCVDRKVLLRLLEDYGVGPKVRGIIASQWAAQQYVTKQAGFYGPVIGTSRGVTQGCIVSPTLFNIVMDAVVREWKHRCQITEHSDPLDLDASFYADDSVIGGTNAGRVQLGLNILGQTMDLVGLTINVTKTQSQTHVPGGIHHSWTSPAYVHRITGEGPSPRTRRQNTVDCPVCGQSMLPTSIQRHLESQHTDYRPQAPTSRRNIFFEETYELNMPSTGTYAPCPVPDCPFGCERRTDMRKHFRHRHPNCMVHFADEMPRVICPDCGRSIAQAQINRHRGTSACLQHQRRHQRLVGIQRSLAARETRFSYGNHQLEEAQVFRYLGKPTPPYCTDITAVHYNVRKARKKWAMLRRILAAQHLPPKIAAIFYKAVVQAVLLYGSETWALTAEAVGILEAFHHRVARQITGEHIYQDQETGEWVYPDPRDTLARAGMYSMRHYLAVRRRYIAKYLTDHPVTTIGRNQYRDNNNSAQKFIWNNNVEPLLLGALDEVPEP